jgi:hypothetical protein
VQPNAKLVVRAVGDCMIGRKEGLCPCKHLIFFL